MDVRTWIFMGLALAGCDTDDGSAANRLLLWSIPRVISAEDAALVVADVTEVTHTGTVDSGCVLFTTQTGFLSPPSGNPIPPLPGDAGLDGCLAPHCAFASASSTQDHRRRAFTIYRVAGPPGTDSLTASYYDAQACPPTTTTPPTVTAALVVTVVSGADASAEEPSDDGGVQ